MGHSSLRLSALRRAPRLRMNLLIALACLVASALPASSSVAISEILYNPTSGDNGEEFIEIINTGGVQEDIAGWCFEGVTFCFDAGTTLDPGEFKLVAADAAIFLATYGLPADGVFIGQLDDAGERLALSDDTPTVIDEFVYDDKPPWAVTADGLGPSLEVIDLAEDNSTARNWRASIHVDGHTAGQVNSVQATGLPPWIDNIQHPSAPAPSDPIVVTAELFDATTVELHYKIDFAVGEVTLAMADDGANNDGGAGDGVWGATIPGQPAGTLVRYRIVANGATATTTHPGIDDTVKYDGTAVIDPALTSGLPIFHWFIDPGSCNEDSDNPGNPCANDAECPNGGCDGYAASIDHTFTDETEPCVLYYDGRLYTGAEVRIRGRSARAWAKKHWKFFFAKGHEFEAPGLIERPVDTFNIQANWSDRSFMREILAWETFRDAGGLWMQTFPVRIERNGQFYGLFTYLEAADRTWLRRMRLDLNATRYKAFDDLRLRTLGELPTLYDKENPVDGDYTDLLDLINGIDAGGVNYVWENADVPGMVNYLAAQTIMHNNDHIGKNYFLYRDLSTHRWVMHPWDLDLTFGRNFIHPNSLNDVIWADVDSLLGEPSHHFTQPPAVRLRRAPADHQPVELHDRRHAAGVTDPADVLPPVAHVDGRHPGPGAIREPYRRTGDAHHARARAGPCRVGPVRQQRPDRRRGGTDPQERLPGAAPRAPVQHPRRVRHSGFAVAVAACGDQRNHVPPVQRVARRGVHRAVQPVDDRGGGYVRLAAGRRGADDPRGHRDPARRLRRVRQERDDVSRRSRHGAVHCRRVPRVALRHRRGAGAAKRQWRTGQLGGL